MTTSSFEWHINEALTLLCHDRGLHLDARAAQRTVSSTRRVLEVALGSEDWVQVGVAVEPSREGQFLSWLLKVSSELVGQDAQEFFFMRKKPGFRLRFQPSGRGARPNLEAALQEVLLDAPPGLIVHSASAIYEPEHRLFGGPLAMAHVHRIFGADSRTWLIARTSAPAAPPWLVSLAMLRSLFGALGIVGWEDLGVWDHVRTFTNRRLPEGSIAPNDFNSIASEVRALWALEASELRAVLPPTIRGAVAAFDSHVVDIGRQWQESYADNTLSTVGPRHAAAYLVIFHWNRGGLPMPLQAVLTETLGSDERVRP